MKMTPPDPKRAAAVLKGKPLIEEDWIRMIGLAEYRRQMHPIRQARVRAKLAPEDDD